MTEIIIEINNLYIKSHKLNIFHHTSGATYESGSGVHYGYVAKYSK